MSGETNDTKRLYFFGDEHTEGDGTMKALLGGKGANLAEMARLGLPVPPGFTITTKVCNDYDPAQGLPAGLMDEVRAAIARLEKATGKGFGDPDNPLLVSVRSGAPISMPGMMDTVLNLGLNPTVADGLAVKADSVRFARDSYRRFIQMFGNVVQEVSGHVFERELNAVKAERGVTEDTELDADALSDVIARYKTVYQAETGEAFPDAPWAQLERAIEAVFKSWNNPRAITYRRLNRIADDLGTAVNVQAMVFGNLGEDCGTGVGFTRNPSTGEKHFYGEYLPNAQGEDVVAGIRTPLPVREARAPGLGLEGRSLETAFPSVYTALMDVAEKLETHYKDVQDLEFTFEHGKLYLLQTRTAKRSGPAWFVTQVAFVDEGVVDMNTALSRIPADSIPQLLAPMLDPKADTAGRELAKALNAGPGAAHGKIAFTADDAEARAAKGEKVILVRDETTPEDIHGMHAAQGILTARGGMTSHAAVVARGMGKPCVVGASMIHVDAEAQTVTFGKTVLGPDDEITIDGSTGQVFAGAVDIMPSEVLQVMVSKTLDPADAPLYQAFSRIMAGADEVRRLLVRTNADTPHDTEVAVALGAQGIGLCRTEHMFFEAERIKAVRKMILSNTREEREAALAEIEPMQAEDFRGIFRALAGRPATIRTLDPPLHEFLPHDDDDIAALAADFGRSVEEVNRRIEQLREANPMLGHRGCRLGIAYPEITAMQARAILRAALDVMDEGVEVHPEIMIPLVGNYREFVLQREIVMTEAEALFESMGRSVEFLVGTMIEVPRAALTAGEIAEHAQFFSFGTNDLTQMTLGVSRDDAGSFLPSYVTKGIYDADPFVSLDTVGVGRLVKLAVNEGRATRQDLKVGICGEHGGDPATVGFCHEVGLDYVSCSPYRVPVARLAAAQAALK